MTSKALLFISSIALVAGLAATPVGAAGLLAGGNGLIAVVGSGPATSDATVNVGLGNGGGDNNNLVDVRFGGKRGLLGTGMYGADASVRVEGGLPGDRESHRGPSGGGRIDTSPLLAGLDLRGLGLDLGPAGSNGSSRADGRVLVGSLGLGSLAVGCSVNDGRDVLQRAARAPVQTANWRRAANVEIIPVKLCPQARAQVAQVLGASGKIGQLRAAVSADALITASLSRTRYDAGSVFAVEATGGKLKVFVF